MQPGSPPAASASQTQHSGILPGRSPLPFADPDPAVFLNAGPDPALQNFKVTHDFILITKIPYESPICSHFNGIFFIILIKLQLLTISFFSFFFKVFRHGPGKEIECGSGFESTALFFIMY